MISVLSFDTMNLPMHDESDSQRFNQQMEDFNVDDYQDKYDLTLELQGSPYLKEGLLKLKILNNDSVDEIEGNSIPRHHLHQLITASSCHFSVDQLIPVLLLLT